MFNYLSKKSKNNYTNYLIFLEKSNQEALQEVPFKRTQGYTSKKMKTGVAKKWHVHFLKQINMVQGKKKQGRLFSGYRFFLHRFRLHINFKYFFSSYYTIRQRVLKKVYKNRKRRFKINQSQSLHAKKGPLQAYYLKNFVEQRSRNRWRYYFKRRYLLHNAGYRFRQRFLAQMSQMRFFFRYNVHHEPRRAKVWHRFKFFVNYRRKPLKFEKKKNNLVSYNQRFNYGAKKVRVRFKRGLRRHQIFLRRKYTARNLKRRQVSLIQQYSKVYAKSLSNNVLLSKKPFWFRRGFKQWRVKKIIRSNIFQNKVRQHFLNLLILKQGLRYYYGGFRLFFLKKIYYELKRKKKQANLKMFIQYLETCLFMVLYRANFVSHPKIAIYLMRDNHDIFYVNGRFIHYALYKVQPGDFIAIKNRVLRKMLNRFLRFKQIPSYLYIHPSLGYGWMIRQPEIRDYDYLRVLPLTSLRYLVSNLKYLL